MGKAYLARHPEWKTGLVVKRMHAHYMDDETIFKRFVHEAKVATYVRHENVAPLVAMGTVGREPFIATEFVFGIGLSTIIERVSSSKISAIPYGIALRLAIALTKGVEAVHEARDVETGEPLNLIHRDIGSRNVLLGFDGRLQLIDLGLGKSILADWQTAADVFAGSPDYMPPEQAMGHAVDRRADVYSTAVTIWELFAGRKRIDEPNVAARIQAALDKHAEQLRPWRPEASVEMEDALKRAMAREVSVRTPQVAILREALELERDRVAPNVSRKDVMGWLEVACATIIAKERRIIEDAEAAAYDLHLPPAEGGETQYLAAQPILFMPPVEREDSQGAGETVDSSAATGVAKVVSQTRQWRTQGAAELRTRLRRFRRWYRRRNARQKLLVNLVPAITIVATVFWLLRPTSDVGPTVTPISVAAPPAPRETAPAPTPTAKAPTPKSAIPKSNPATEVAVPPSTPPKPAATPTKPATKRGPRLPPARRARKNALVRRLRSLRRKRYDMAWQRRLTTLGSKLSRARTASSLDRIEGQIQRMEKEL